MITWQPLSTLSISEIPLKFRDAFTSKDSMTHHFKKQLGTDFHLSLLGQTSQRLLESESMVLHLDPNEKHVVREIVMGKQDEPWLFARCVLPNNLFSGETATLFSTLGQKPLGELLFNDPTLKRSEFEWGIINKEEQDYPLLLSFLTNNTVIWARRSLFIFKEKPLCLSEFFLPSCQLLNIKNK